MRNIFKTALIVGTLSTSLIVMADTPKKPDAKPDVTKKEGSGSAKTPDKAGSGSAKAAGSGSAKAPDKAGAGSAKAPAAGSGAAKAPAAGSGSAKAK